LPELSPFDRGLPSRKETPDWSTGMNKDKWEIGESAFFEYHCFRSHNSQDALLWYHDHQPVEVIAHCGELPYEEYASNPEIDTLRKRIDAGIPYCYRVKFQDGLEYTVMEDELYTSEEDYDLTLPQAKF
jgi:hypothetical protein